MAQDPIELPREAVAKQIGPARGWHTDDLADLIGQLGLDVRRCDIERSPLPFGDDTFACSLLCETFEHLHIDPAFVEIVIIARKAGAGPGLEPLVPTGC